MADITMCTQILCPKAETCYRRQATPSEIWQSYAQFEYTLGSDGVVICEYYWPILGGEG